jgi:chemotaxis protein MotA
MADKSTSDAAPAAKSGGLRPDLATVLGLIIAAAGILGGLVLEGGKVTDVAQVTAAMIVFGGTVGAVLITTPLPGVIQALKALPMVFLDRGKDPNAALEEIIRYATKARKNSIISLETDLESIADPFLKKALSLAVDGSDMQEIRKIMELEISQTEKNGEAKAKVYEAAGGYSPTIGIIGAVLGLIQVMKHLENIDEVGRGIAVAFVATVYGVAVANIFFLPCANKLKARMHSEIENQELLLEGVLSIVEGLNPKLIRVKLEAFVHTHAGKVKKAKEDAPAAEPASARG